MNNVRGYLPEFLLARAIGGIGSGIGWGPYEIRAPDGPISEVKDISVATVSGVKTIADPGALFVKGSELARDLLARGSDQDGYKEIPDLLDS